MLEARQLILTGSGSSIIFVLPGDVFHGAIVPTAPVGGPSGVPGAIFASGTDINSVTNDSQAVVGVVGRSADGTRGPYVYFGSLQQGASNIQLVPVYAVGGGLAFAAPGVAGGNLVAETWHAITPLNGWANAGGTQPPFQTKRLAELGGVALQGSITPGTTTDGTQIGVMPAGYFNSTHRQSVFVGMVGSTGAVNNAPWLGIDTAGSITVNGVNEAGLTRIVFNGIIWTDA